MTSRLWLYAAGLAGFLAAATLMTAPYHPKLVVLPADWLPSPQTGFALYPSGPIYSGERMSLVASGDSDPEGGKLLVRLDSPAADPLGGADFIRNGNFGTWSAPLPWIWNTEGQAGWHTLFLYLSEDTAGGAMTELLQYPVQVLPESLQPALRRDARWRQVESACCVYFFLSGTESERDIEILTAQSESTYAALAGRMGGESPQITLLFLPRMYGQGGLATQEGIVSYLDRNPAGADFSMLVKHEMAHLFAIARYGAGLRAPLLLQEGWTVYLSGGHYQSPEDLQARAAALLRLGDYTPLADLADSFYESQHEAAYIEAGAFVEYLAGRFGEERVKEMLFDPVAVESAAASLNSMMVKHLGRTLTACEADWLDALRALAPDTESERDVAFLLAMLDLFRRYQRLYVPGSRLFDLWLPDPARARSEQITADFLPSPAKAESLALETLFVEARQSARERDWLRAWNLLDAVARSLDAKERRVPEPLSVDPAAETYRVLTSAILRAGYEPLRIDWRGDSAAVEMRDPKNLRKEVRLWHWVRGSWLLEG